MSLSLRKDLSMLVHSENTMQPVVSARGACAARPAFLSRRRFLGASALAMAAGLVKPGARSTAGSEQRVVVGAHPWVYAATQPRYDIYPILDRIFSDVAYAGIDGIELMHTALRPEIPSQRSWHSRTSISFR